MQRNSMVGLAWNLKRKEKGQKCMSGSRKTLVPCVLLQLHGGALTYLWNYPSLKGLSPLWKCDKTEIPVNFVFSIGRRRDNREF